jgi:hypothetical protein
MQFALKSVSKTIHTLVDYVNGISRDYQQSRREQPVVASPPSSLESTPIPSASQSTTTLLSHSDSNPDLGNFPFTTHYLNAYRQKLKAMKYVWCCVFILPYELMNRNIWFLLIIFACATVLVS